MSVTTADMSQYPPTSQRRLTVHAAVTVSPTRLTLNARDFVVAPAVLIVEGVLNGAYVPGELFDAQSWDGMPVVCNHPLDASGEPRSARDPEVLATHGIGHLYRTQVGTGQRGTETVRSLQAEIWLDIAQVDALGGEAAQALLMLEAQEHLEISTGFYGGSIPQRGTAYGTPFTEIVTDIHPDHLALLPNGTGACSWDSGCGAPRLHRLHCHCAGPACTCPPLVPEEDVPMVAPMEETPARGWRGFLQLLRQFVQREEATTPAALATETPLSDEAPTPDEATAHSEVQEPEVDSEAVAIAAEVLHAHQTDADIREALYAALAREMDTDWTPIFIDSIESATQSFVYRRGERLLQRTWMLDSLGILQLDPQTRDVQRDTRFMPVGGTEADAEDDLPDSNQDIPGVMAAFATTPRCPSCAHFMVAVPPLPGRPPPVDPLAMCPACGLQSSTASLQTLQTEDPSMTQPTVAPVAIRARVNNLITNKQYGWTERDRMMLESQTEAFLIRLESQPVIIPPVATEITPPTTAIEAIGRMPEHLQDMFMQMHQDYQNRRQAALGMLIANRSCPFETDELQTMSLERLEKLVAMGAGVEYSGRGLPAAPHTPEAREDPPPPPNTLDLVLERQKALGLR